MKKAPDFELQDQNEKTHKLSDYKGKWLIIYFYPKDDTPGCTTEACDFRDAGDALAEYGNATVLGISKDNIKSHKKFSEKHNLNFSLLSDPEHETIEAYGAWGPKKFMGREFLGIKRNTYIINPEGYIVKEYENVTPKTHIATLLRDIKNLQEERSS